MDREEYKRMRDLINEALDAGRPIERIISGQWRVLNTLGTPSVELRVQPAPPQPKYRPLNDDELMDLVRNRVVVQAETTLGKKTLGQMAWTQNSGFSIGLYLIDTETLRDAITGQPIQVEIKD